MIDTVECAQEAHPKSITTSVALEASSKPETIKFSGLLREGRVERETEGLVQWLRWWPEPLLCGSYLVALGETRQV